MRVLTFTTLFPNRTEPEHGVFIHQRMVHLHRRTGNRVVALAPVPYSMAWLPGRWSGFAGVPREETIGGMRVYHPRYPLLPKVSMPLHGLLIFLGAASAARRLHREHRFDVIDAHYVYPDGLAAALLARLLGIPVVVSARGTDMNLFPAFRWIRPMIRWTLRQARGGIGVCSALRDAMVREGLSPQKAWVIGNGVDPERFFPLDRLQARKRLAIPESEKVIVSVGSLIPRKGLHFLIPAMSAVRKKHTNARLYLIGKGESRAELEALGSQLRLEDAVRFVGPVPNEQLRTWYSAADVSCLASSREGWANVLLESMACGTPAVATRVWGAPEVIVSPELGILVEQTTPELACALIGALAKDWDRAGIASYAARRTWDVVAAEVENMLAACIHDRTMEH